MGKIQLEYDLANYIESLQNDVETRKAVVSYMIANGYDITSNNFKHYQNELKECVIKYNEAKMQLTEMVKAKIQSDNFTWNLDFATRELRYEKV